MSKPLILITNDDGYNAKGINALVNAVKNIADIIVVAPDRPQSGMGHAITVNEPIRCFEIDLFEDIKAYSCTGTPVDCVKMGFYLLGDKSPDLILSGINHGSNVSTNILYSGTMSAAVEGALEGIPSIGFSLTSHLPNADFSTSIKYVKKITEKVLNNGLKKGVCLNVNIPAVNAELVKGIKVCRQGKAFWDDTFDKRTDPLGNEYYWLTGSFSSEEQGKDADVNFLKNNYVTIVPTQFDMTCYSSVEELNKWSF
jgi:5'-nucleotidase